MVVVTYDGTTIKVDEHGELIKSAKAEREIAGKENGANFGSGYFGLIEGITFFDRALTAKEVSRWYLYQVLEHRKLVEKE